MNAVILAHGGAGAKVEDSDGAEAACRVAAPILMDGQPDAALRAAVAASVVLEDDPRFNAGIGSNQRLDGSTEQDAIVATCDGRLGAVAAIRSTKNPTLVAQEVLTTPHWMLCGDGATTFARERGYPEHDCSTERTRRRLVEAHQRLKSGELRPTEELWAGFDMHGTIGAVARAADGTFAAASSTGGTSIMMPGRVGDTPIYGAGIMVSEHAAIVATGDGEEIVRNLMAVRLHQRLLEGATAQEATDEAVASLAAPWEVGFLVVTRDSYAIAATKGVIAAHALECNP